MQFFVSIQIAAIVVVHDSDVEEMFWKTKEACYAVLSSLVLRAFVCVIELTDHFKLLPFLKGKM